MILINPQWQGGGEKSTLYGAKELEKFCFSNGNKLMKLSVRHEDRPEKKNNICFYDSIIKQTKDAFDILNQADPKKLLTVGGGCDADLASLAYMNDRLNGNMTVFWFDAHGDLNAPSESTSGLFYGVPARMLMEPQYDFRTIIRKPLETEKFIQIGGRNFDQAEIKFMKDRGIKTVSASEESETELEKTVRQKPSMYA